MKKFFLFIVLAVMVAPVLSDSGLKAEVKGEKRVTQARKLRNFEKIAAFGSATIHYEQGTSFSVKVVAPSDVINDVKTTVSGKTLNISIESKPLNLKYGPFSIKGNITSDVDVYVTSPDLVGVILSGSGTFTCDKHLDTDNLALTLKGSGDMVFKDIICDDIRTELTGSGDVRLDKVDALRSSIVLYGSGDITVNQKNVKRTDIELKGSGDITVSFSNCDTAESSLKGSGDITLKGSLKSFKKHLVGSGDYHVKGLVVK